MPRKRVVTREFNITIANCLYVHPGKKDQKKMKIELVGSLNPHQIDNRKPVPPELKNYLFVKCLKVELARARYEMPIEVYMEKAQRKGLVIYGKEKENNKNSGVVQTANETDHNPGSLLS